MQSQAAGVPAPYNSRILSVGGENIDVNVNVIYLFLKIEEEPVPKDQPPSQPGSTSRVCFDKEEGMMGNRSSGA
jgi:hypothetical protein